MTTDARDFAQALAAALNPNTYWGKIVVEASWPPPRDRYAKPFITVERAVSVSINFTGEETPAQRSAMIFDRENEARKTLREEVDNEIRLLWEDHKKREAELFPKPAPKPQTERPPQPDGFPLPPAKPAVQPLRPGPASTAEEEAEERYNQGADEPKPRDPSVSRPATVTGWSRVDRQPSGTNATAFMMWGEEIETYTRGEFVNKGGKTYTAIKAMVKHITGKPGGGTDVKLVERIIFESLVKGTPADNFFINDGAKHVPAKPAFVMVGHDGTKYANAHGEFLSVVTLGVTLDPSAFQPKN